MTLDEKLVKYIVLPTNMWFIPWSLFTSLIYVFSYWNDSFDLAFGLVPILLPWKKTLQTLCSLIMLIDIFTFFFVADRKDGRELLQKEQKKEEK